MASGTATNHYSELGELDDALRAWLLTIELDANYDFTRFGRVWRSWH